MVSLYSASSLTIMTYRLKVNKKKKIDKHSTSTTLFASCILQHNSLAIPIKSLLIATNSPAPAELEKKTKFQLGSHLLWLQSTTNKGNGL